jgi:hypothetical protein
MCHDDPSGVVENKLPGGRQVSQCGINLLVGGTECGGQFGGAGWPSLMGEDRIDRHPHIFNVHEVTMSSKRNCGGSALGLLPRQQQSLMPMIELVEIRSDQLHRRPGGVDENPHE